MSRRERGEIYALVRQSRQQVERAQELQRQLEDVILDAMNGRRKRSRARRRRAAKY